MLNHLNLHVKQGETIALVGESGAGKSTVLNLVIGFHLADGGKVLLDGNDMRETENILPLYHRHPYYFQGLYVKTLLTETNMFRTKN